MSALQRGEAVEITTETQLSVSRYVGTWGAIFLSWGCHGGRVDPSWEGMLAECGMDII